MRPLKREDLANADHIMRVAFGTFLGVADPATFGEGMDHVKTRWLADPNAAFGAEADGELVGSSFVTNHFSDPGGYDVIRTAWLR